QNAIGWAADKVRTPAPLDALVKGLLHNVALFENLEEALNAIAKNSEIAATTLRGEYISHEGILFVGSGKVRSDSLLERKAQIEGKIAGSRSEISHLEAQRNEALRQEEDASALLAEMRIAAATHGKKHQNLLAQRAPMLARQMELAELMATRRADIENYEARLVAQGAEDDAARNAIEQQRQEYTRREAEIWKLVAERASQLETINSDEANLRAVRDRLSELQEKRGTHSVRQTQLQLQIEHLAEHVMERYRIDLRLFEPDTQAHEKVLHAQLKRAVRPESVVAVAGRGEELRHEKDPRLAAAATEDQQKLI